MANRRMFSRDVVETDRFLGMPLTSQALYFHLGMEADDDGFVPSPRKVQRAVGCTEGDLKHLASCGYIIPFESGVIVIGNRAIMYNLTVTKKRYTRKKPQSYLPKKVYTAWIQVVYRVFPLWIHRIG